MKINPAIGRKEFANPYFRSALTIITESTDLDQVVTQKEERIKENMAKFKHEDSEQTFGYIEKMEIHLHEFKPLTGSSYIPFP